MLPRIMLAIQARQFQIELNRRLKVSRRLMRDQSDPFLLPDVRFKELFRLNKDMMHYIINHIAPHLHQRRRADGICTILKIYSAIIFFACGSYQRRTTGQDYLVSMSQQSVGRSIHEVCDYDLKILSINACYAGASHDAFIWSQSVIKEEMERCYRNGDTATWLIGDSGYPQQPWLMTPRPKCKPEKS
ncbi:hypothetical protein NQ317_015319 [Molorchus minor]|uniref:DDE Tnp4 domain-containing protein n=1 Tax=Molorchus minor TaxID=1323400 RepID=A0ABQ9JD51_9CUCU|nr:hypothetical protein NQ317_015319 [Molorchus minor]